MNRGTSPIKGSESKCIATISAPNLTLGHFSHVSQSGRNNRNRSACPKRINITVTALWVATPILSTVSVAAVCVAVTTNQWLITQENIKNGNYTGKGDQEYFPKSTVSGLWTLCHTNPGKQGFFCSNIEYFPKEEYSPDLKDSTMAIPYTVTKSATFFILSTFLLFLGEICCLFGHFSRQRRLLTFISGVIFIISGLLMLIGLVMYISIFKAEIGGKLRPTSQLQPAVFTYKYGYSFILYVSGFVSTEISGTCAVFLYIYWHQKDWRKKGCEIRSKFVSPTFLFDIDPVNRLYPFCRKHPPYLSPNGNGCSYSDEIFRGEFAPALQRRLYLDRHSGLDSIEEFYSPVCLKHSLSCGMVNEIFADGNLKGKTNRMIDANVLNESYPSISSERCRNHVTPGYPCEFLSRDPSLPVPSTKSKTNWTSEEFDEECSSTDTHDHEFVPFDLDDNPPVPTKCNSLNDFLNDEFFYKALSKSTPV